MPPVNLAVTSTTAARHTNGRVICGAGIKRMSLFIVRCSTEMPRLTTIIGRYTGGTALQEENNQRQIPAQHQQGMVPAQQNRGA